MNFTTVGELYNCLELYNVGELCNCLELYNVGELYNCLELDSQKCIGTNFSSDILVALLPGKELND